MVPDETCDHLKMVPYRSVYRAAVDFVGGALLTSYTIRPPTIVITYLMSLI